MRSKIFAQIATQFKPAKISKKNNGLSETPMEFVRAYCLRFWINIISK